MQEMMNFINHHQILVAGIVLLFVLLVIIELLRAKRLAIQVNAQRVTQLINRENAVVIDIRDIEAFKAGHIIDAVNIRPDEMKNTSKKFDKYKAKTLIIICQSGVESYKVAAQLYKEGYNVYSLAGGLRSWNEAQLPLVKG